MNKTALMPLLAALILFLAAGCSGSGKGENPENTTVITEESVQTSSSWEDTESRPDGSATETDDAQTSSPDIGESDTVGTPVSTVSVRKTGTTPASTTTPRPSQTTPKQTTTVSTPVDSGGYKSIYNQLSSGERTAYDELLEGIVAQEKYIYLSARISVNALYKVYEALLLTAAADEVYPPRQYKYSYSPVSGYVISVELAYDYTKARIDQMNARLESRVEEILAKLGAYKTDAARIRYLHDAVVSGCSYSADGEYADNAYGALVDGKAVCEGYSRALLLLCRRAGINCILVTGYAGEEHMWNMAEISGKWYHIDATWNDPSFEDGREDFIGYTYLNLSDEMIKRDHTIDTSLFTVPKANSEEANYHVYNNLYAKSAQSAFSIIESAMESAAQNGRGGFSVRMSSASVYEAVKSGLFDSAWSGLFKITDRVNSRAGNMLIKSSIEVYRDDIQYVIRISFDTRN